MKTFLLVLIMFLTIQLNGISQSEESKTDSSEIFSIGSDVVSRYVWRGSLLSQSPAFQPSASLTINNLTLGAWGSYTFAAESEQEVDLYLAYTLGKFSLTINDYFNPVQDDTIKGDYFKWDSETTRHSLEGILTFDGPESFPFQFVAGVFFYGNDKDEETGDNVYSTYFEINRTWESGSYSIMPFFGVTPKTGLYSDDGFQVVNLGVQISKSLKFSSFEVPLNVAFITNPHKESVFMVVGLTF